MKFIKNFLSFLNEGAYIDPENPDQVILTYANLLDSNPNYDNEVLVTQVDKREKRGEYLIDKYSALVLPNLDQTQGLSVKKIKSIDHLGRPKATMDLLKDGNIKGGQAALNTFLQNAIPQLDLDKIDYVCSLGSTGGLVKMMSDFFVSVYGSTPVDLPKTSYSTILDAINWDSLFRELSASERVTKDDYKDDLEKYLRQNKYIIELAKKGSALRTPYKDPVTGEKITEIFKKPSADSDSIISTIQKKQTTILAQFFAAIEDSVDVPGTPLTVFNKFKNGIKGKIKDILEMYKAETLNTVGDVNKISEVDSRVYEQIKKEIEVFLKNINFQPEYKLRTSGTSIGRSMRKIFKDKYAYTTSFEDALLNCMLDNKKMIIIDDNISTGTDFRNIDRKIQQILSDNDFDIFGRDRNTLIENVKMFVLYDMGSKLEVKHGSTIARSLVTQKNTVADFKQSILKEGSKIPAKVVMSYVLLPKDKTPILSLPSVKLKLNQSTGEIEDVNIDTTKTQLKYEKDYDPMINPVNWKFPFNIGTKIVNNNGIFTDQFQNWAKSIGLWVNGEKFA